MNCACSHPRLFSIRNATAAEQLNLQRSSQEVSHTVTKDRPQFRTQRLGQSSRRYSLSLREIHWFSFHCDHALDSLSIFFFILFFVFSSLLHPHLSASISCFTSSSMTIMIISVSTLLIFSLMHSFTITVQLFCKRKCTHYLIFYNLKWTLMTSVSAGLLQKLIWTIRRAARKCNLILRSCC